MADRFSKDFTQLDSPAQDGFVMGVGNTANVFSQPTRAVYVGVAGNLEVVMIGSSPGGNNSNTVLLIQGVPAGTMLPLRISAIGANTAANGIIGFF